MTLPQTYELFDYWGSYPPENESLAALLSAYTTWEPKNARPMTHEEHMASLEKRWKAGAMNVKQIFEATGGVISLDAQRGTKPPKLPGIGPFPGAH
jgi:hypothetical protein